MSIVTLVAALALVWCLLWLIGRFVKDGTAQTVLSVAVVLCVVVWLLNVLGVIHLRS